MRILKADQVALAVIAGGLGRRMGGPKSNLSVRGVPILRFLAKQLTWPGPTMLVLGEDAQVPEGSDAFDRIVRDSGVGAGPLRAIASALEASSAPALIIIPVDMPRLQHDTLTSLIQAMNLHPRENGLLLSRRSGVVEPFPAIFRKEAAPTLRAMLARGSLALKDLTQEQDLIAVPAPVTWDESIWMNLNEPTDLPDWVAAPQKSNPPEA